jgi:AmmeMemoRadiSam system protein B
MRAPKFAGAFYPLGKKELSKMVEGMLSAAVIPTKAVDGAFAYVAPHAGYIYSGKTAAFTYKAISLNRRLKETDTIVVLGPNHTGYGKPISISLEDWQTPIGVSLNDKELSKAIAGLTNCVEVDEQAHSDEHSIEVQLPFLQLVAPEKKVCMICMGDQSIEASELLAELITRAAKKAKRRIIVIASSDFDHYEPGKTAKEKDTQLHGAISRLDCGRFNELLKTLDDTTCGHGPITSAMTFAKGMGASKGVLMNYSNSGDETGDYSGVVAYSSIAFV